MPHTIILLVALLPAASASGAANCPCLTTFPAGVDPAEAVIIGGSTYKYPLDYGLSTCKRHDNSLPPACNAASNTPEWCGDTWCYVDQANCNLPTTSSSYFPGSTLHYSYSTCGAANTFTLWFGAEGGSGEASSGSESHVVGDIVTVIHDYLISLSTTLEDNEPELRGVTTACSAPAPPSCPCATCKDDTEEAVFWTNSSYTLATWNASGTQTSPPYSFDFSSVSLTAKASISTTSPAGIMERCLSGYLENAFLRVAAREADISNRVGYEYAAFQELGNYVQWPAQQWCTSSYDPRFRSWYVSAASGPKDIVIVLDVSGSMRNHGRMELMKSAAKMVLKTFTEADYVGLVKFSTKAEVANSATTLARATELETARLSAWVDDLSATGTTNLKDALDKALGLLEASSDMSSGCTKAILVLSDGRPDSDPDYAAVRSKAAALGGVQLFTYALGANAQKDILKRLSCMNDGALWAVTDNGNLGNAMADYFTFLAPLQSPCQVRWTYYNDINTGAPLLAACLATFKKETVSSATSCAGGTSGCVPDLLGVACMDVSLIVTQAQIDARPDAQSFYDRVKADQTACVKVTPTPAQLQMLRKRIHPNYGNAVCSADLLATPSDYAEPAACAAGNATGGNGTTPSSAAGQAAEEGGSTLVVVIVAIGAAAAVIGVGLQVRALMRPRRGRPSGGSVANSSRHPPGRPPPAAVPMSTIAQPSSSAYPPQASVPVVHAQAVPMGQPAYQQPMGVAVGVPVA